jgi:hypothetical protein
MATATWTYSDWRRQSTDAATLEMLRQHINEVSQVTLGRKTRMGADFPVDPGYLKRLEVRELQLSVIVEPSGVAAKQALGVAKSQASFVRD